MIQCQFIDYDALVENNTGGDPEPADFLISYLFVRYIYDKWLYTGIIYVIVW